MKQGLLAFQYEEEKSTTGMTRDFPYWESSGSRGSPNEMVAS